MDSARNRTEGLSAAKRALLLQRLQEKNAAANGQAAIRKAFSDRAPLSFAQERLWFLNELEPHNGAYNLPTALRLRGVLNVQALQKALDEIVRRHQTLRTTFDLVDDQPEQVIRAPKPVAMPLVDLTGVPEAARDAETMRLCSEEAALPFNLAEDLSIRAKLFRLAPAEHIFLLNVHHIASDGWSLGVQSRELSLLYNAFNAGKESPLAELPVQYVDFAAWQRERLSSKSAEAQLDYWKRKLDKAPARLEFPTDRPRPLAQSYRGAYALHKLPKPLVARLTELGRAEGATLFMTLLAAFQTLLHRYTGSEDILLGSVVAGRDRSDLESLIGFFVNTIVFRANLSGNPDFRTLLQRTRDDTLEAFAHQEAPFEMLVQALQPKRDPSYTPFFQVMLVLQNTPGAQAELTDLEVTPILVRTPTSKFDLTLYITEQKDSFRLAAEYCTDLFDPETMERLLASFHTLLDGIAASADQKLSALPVLTEPQRSQILLDWNQTEKSYPARSLHELIEEQAQRTPDAVAACFDRQTLTYAQLDQRANHFARILASQGAGPESFVALCAERNLDLLVGVLAILKAGAAYVPIDPNYPKDRIAFYLEDSRARFILTQRKLVPSLPPHIATVICLDENPIEQTAPNPVRPASLSDAAYVIYTSGSTGKPKGVVIEHRQAVNFVHWALESFTDAEMAGVLASTSICFDLSIFEIFATLSRGGKVILADNALHLSNLPAKNQVTLVNTVPSAMAELVQAEALPPSVEVVNLAGEPLPTALVNRIYALKRVKKVNDLYGPSETTTYSTWTLRKPAEPPRVGRPIANTQIYILDKNLQPVPAGVPGELHIGGAGLARGYHNRPELTAEKFIANPFSADPKARLYKTGDLARFMRDGSIEYLGRLDHQVKIRGFRIELGEIEALLNQHPDVRGSVVVVNEESQGDKRLVAYLASDRAGLEPAEFQAMLRTKLPEYMIPATFVFLTSLPLSPNGKIDRKALPAPNFDSATAKFVAPRNPTEAALAGIWQSVLGVKQVGVNDDFFELGGHSLLAVKVQARVEKELGRRVPLAAFFQAPTVSDFAQRLSPDQTTAVAGLTLVSPRKHHGQASLFCFHFLDSSRRLAKRMSANWSVYGVESPIADELRSWHQGGPISVTVEDLATRCVATVRHAQPHGPYALAGWCFGGILAYEVARQLADEGEKVSLLAMLDAFYTPGCKPLAMPGLRRWAYHARRFSTGGFGYLSTKMQAKRDIKTRRNTKLANLRGYDGQPTAADIEEVRLPQAKFLGQLLKTYRAKPYNGRTILIRSMGEPSFRFDHGRANGWETVINGDLQIEDIICGHNVISEEPFVADVAAKLEAFLSNARAHPSSGTTLPSPLPAQAAA